MWFRAAVRRRIDESVNISDVLIVVTGSDSYDKSAYASGYVIDVQSGKVLKTWAPDHAVLLLFLLLSQSTT